MIDDFIPGLRKTWQSQELDAALALRRLRRNRWTPHIALAAEILGCAVALFVGIWFAWLAAHMPQNRLLYALSAVVILVTIPVLTVATAVTRRSSLEWDEETPQVLLRIGIRRAESSLKAIRLGRWHIGIIILFVAVLWVLELWGLLNVLGFLIVYTAICLAGSVAMWFWMKWRVKRVSDERDAYIRLLAMIEIDDSNDNSISH